MTAPWLSYWTGLQRAPTRLWSTLGQVQAYGDVLTGSLLTPAVTARLGADWRERAARATAAGDGGAAPSDDVVAAVAALYDDIDRHDRGATDRRITPQLLCQDNAALAEIDRAVRAAAMAGAGPGGDGVPSAPSLASQFSGPPNARWPRLSQCCDWLNGQEFLAAADERIQTALLRALAAHVHLLLLAPFAVCNEATAHFAGYRILRAAGLPAMAAHLPAVQFAATRDHHSELMAEVGEAGGRATIDFITYAIEGVVHGLRDQVAELRTVQADSVWRDLITQAFQGRSRAGDRRRRLLLEDLAAQDAPVRIGQLRHLTPRLAEAYAGRSAKTLSRDVKWLEAEGLVQRTLYGVRPRTDALYAFAARAA